jgi:hypothetical protein
MKYALLVLSALLLVSPFVGARDKTAAPAEKVVGVDPADLKPPLEDAIPGLINKYEGKLVRFTGVLHNHGRDAQTKRAFIDLVTEVTVGNGPKAAKEKITVRAYVELDKPTLKQKGMVLLTVEGVGEVVEEEPVLRVLDAKVTAVKPVPKKT